MLTVSHFSFTRNVWFYSESPRAIKLRITPTSVSVHLDSVSSNFSFEHAFKFSTSASAPTSPVKIVGYEVNAPAAGEWRMKVLDHFGGYDMVLEAKCSEWPLSGEYGVKFYYLKPM